MFLVFLLMIKGCVTMTELETMQHAKNYIDSLANGIDPLTGEIIKDDSVINNVRISRCLFYVSNVLQDVINNGGVVGRVAKPQKIAFSITDEQCSKILITQDPVGVSIISKRIGEVLDENVKTLPAVHIANWLVDNGYLVENIYSGSKKKVTTPKGEQLGILTIDAVNPQGVPYKKNIYDANAQKFIISNLNKIAADIVAKQV